jgi:DNA processing protein
LTAWHDRCSQGGVVDLKPFVATSLLRSGTDTSAGRLVKAELLDTPPASWAGAVAARLWPNPVEQREQLAGAFATADAMLQRASARGYRLVTCLDEEYPAILREIVDPPIVLWTRGDLSALTDPCVAIVGSRKALPASVEIAKRFAFGLAESGIIVVSGLARGVDSAAHVGALEAGGKTVAVQGCGLDEVFPKENANLAQRIAGQGVVMSELPPFAPPMAHHFPMRNRIISGLCRAVVIVEAGDRSGSLITARMALEQGRDVLAVPGNVLAGHHTGCHRLIKDGAPLVETVEDVLLSLGRPRAPVLAGIDDRNDLQLSDLEANMAPGEPYFVDDLIRLTGQSASTVMVNLGLLELRGRVDRTPAGAFTRLGGRREQETK